MAKSFSASVEEFVDLTQHNMLVVLKASLQDTIDDAQKPTAKGGKMRVDTGFLRASGIASLDGVPTGPTRNDGFGPHSFDKGGAAANVTATIGEITYGDTFHFGWTAHYAKYREAYDAFLDSALQKWPETVKRNGDEVRKRASEKRRNT